MKTQFNVRLSEECIAEIARVAGMIDGGTQAGVIERWAMESARGVAGVRKLEVGSGKKSGARGEVFQDDVPDEVMKARGKRGSELLKTVPGLKAGSALAISPVVKRPAKTVVRDMDLATGRIDRKPITRPNGKL